MSGVTPQQTAARLIREREAQQRAERMTLRAPAATGSLSTIEKLLALQIRLLAIGFGFERDGEVLADVKQDLAAVRRGDFDEVRPQRGLKALNLADDELGDVVADRVPDPAVDHRDNLSRHSRLPRLHGRLTRYVAVGAILVALRQLQRRAWTRRAASPLAAVGHHGRWYPTSALRRYLRARRVADHRRIIDELALVIFWEELRRGDR